MTSTCYYNGVEFGTTSGKTENKIFEMIADFYLTCHDVPSPRFWHRFKH